MHKTVQHSVGWTLTQYVSHWEVWTIQETQSCQSMPRGQRDGGRLKVRELWEGIKRKGGAGMLAGEEERSCWQEEEDSAKTAQHIKPVYIILYIYMGGNSRRASLIKEVMLSC